MKLFDTDTKLLGDKEASKCNDRRPEENKKMLDVQDTLELYRKLDQTKTNLPFVVTVTLAKVPGDKSAESDLIEFAVSLGELKSQIIDLHKVSVIM